MQVALDGVSLTVVEGFLMFLFIKGTLEHNATNDLLKPVFIFTLSQLTIFTSDEHVRFSAVLDDLSAVRHLPGRGGRSACKVSSTPHFDSTAPAFCRGHCNSAALIRFKCALEIFSLPAPDSPPLLCEISVQFQFV